MPTLDNKNYIEMIISRLEKCSDSSSTIHQAKTYICSLNSALQLASLYPDSIYNTDKYINNIINHAIKFMEDIANKGE